MESNIRITYFAQFREQANVASESLPLPEHGTTTAAALFDDRAEHHGFSLGRNIVRPAVNGSYVTWDYNLQPGDELVFIPPVAGG